MAIRTRVYFTDAQLSDMTQKDMRRKLLAAGIPMDVEAASDVVRGSLIRSYNPAEGVTTYEWTPEYFGIPRDWG